MQVPLDDLLAVTATFFPVRAQSRACAAVAAGRQPPVRLGLHYQTAGEGGIGRATLEEL